MVPLIMFCGASASGKTTMCDMLCRATGQKMVKSVTTRARRPSDNPDEYDFTTREEFMELDLVEYVEYGGNLYGCTKQAVDAAAFGVFNLPGVVNVLDYCSQIGRKCVVVGMLSTADARKRRMLARGDSDSKAEERIAVDDEEFPVARMEELCDYLVVNSTNVLTTATEVFKILYDTYSSTEWRV